MTKARILVVEDEHIVALDIKRMLLGLGYEVPAIAASGKQAIERSVEIRPDLALMDIRLRGKMDGIEAAAQIQSAVDIPVVYLTAFADDTTLDRARTTTPFGYVLKPFTEQELHSAIEMALYKHKAEQKLRESEMRFRALIENASDIIAVLDNDGQIKYASPSVQRVLGYAPQEMVGQAVSGFVHPDDLGSANESLNRALAGSDRRRPVAVRLRHKNGSWRVVEGIGHDWRSNPAIDGVVINIRDITERKRAEESLLRSSRLEATATLAGGIAHDLNNLMASVLGYAELLKAGIAESSDRQSRRDALDMLTKISDSAQQASELAQQMLDFARVGRRQPQMLNVNDSVRQVLRIEQRSLPWGTGVEFDADPNLWRVEADPSQIKQVLLNLFTNALEATSDGGQITIRTRNVRISPDRGDQDRDLDPGRYVCLSVQDTGCGMDEQTQARAFEPFFSTKFQGRGMGLAAVYGIVKMHGGDIELTSQLQKGTTVDVCLPALPQQTATVQDAQRTGAQASRTKRGTETVLVIEDEESMLRVLLRMIQRLGYRALAAGGGKQAVEIAQTFDGPIALALLDLEAPTAQCVEILQQLARCRPAIQVLVCSDYRLDDKVQALLQAGAHAAIQKPFQMHTLAEKLRTALDD